MGRRASIAGVLALLALLPLGALPAGAGGPGNQDPKGANAAPAQSASAPAQAAEAPHAKGRTGANGKGNAAGKQQAATAPIQGANSPAAAPEQVQPGKPGNGRDKQARGEKAKQRVVSAAMPVSATAAQVATGRELPPAPTAEVTSAPTTGPGSAGRDSRRARGELRRVRQRAAARPSPRAPAPRPLATARFVPAPIATTVELLAPTSGVPAAGTPGKQSAGDRGGEAPKKADDADGVFQVAPIVFNALSESVAFVPAAVKWALGVLAALALALFAIAFARDRRARTLGRERVTLMADIEALGNAVSPALPEALGGLALSVTSSPASGPVTGGDFHDAFPLSQDRVAVLVGDVAGRGRKVLSDGQLVRHAVRAYLEAGLDPRAAIAMMGAVVDEREEPLFASVLVAVHDRRTGTLTFASAGHEPPVFVSEHGAALPPVSGWSPPLGAGLETGRRQTAIPLPEGTAVCLLTDGVTEARAEGERIGISRVIKWLSALGPGAMSSDVVERLRSEAEPEDDV
ncbi:MAG: PP2C family protein-serine/threonine phosphatase, partial [Solirubrobacteraceae bacterium]